MRGHAGELTNEPDCEFWICADHALESLSRDHEEGYLLHGDSGDRVGRIAEQGHLTQQVALDESVQDRSSPSTRRRASTVPSWTK